MYPHFVQMECTRQKSGGGVLFAHPICDCIIEIEKKNSKNREKAILFLFLAADRKKKRWENETKRNKTHKNGNEKINFHLNGCLRLHINATYTLHTQ